MTNLDWICLAVIALFGFLGWRRGLVGEIVRIASVLGGIAAGFSGYHSVALFFAKTISFLSLRTLNIICFIILFIAGMALILFLGMLITKILRLTILGVADRVGGLCVGAAKGTLILGLLIWIVSFMPSVRSGFSLEKTKVALTSSRMVTKIYEAAAEKKWKSLPLKMNKKPEESAAFEEQTGK